MKPIDYSNKLEIILKAENYFDYAREFQNLIQNTNPNIYYFTKKISKNEYLVILYFKNQKILEKARRKVLFISVMSPNISLKTSE